MGLSPSFYVAVFRTGSVSSCVVSSPERVDFAFSGCHFSLALWDVWFMLRYACNTDYVCVVRSVYQTPCLAMQCSYWLQDFFSCAVLQAYQPN